MSKIAVLIAVPALIGVVAVGALQLDTAAELEETRGRVMDLEAGLAAVAERADVPAPRTVDRRESARLRSVEERLLALEQGVGEIEPRVAPVTAEEGVAAAAPAGLAAGGAEIERAVEQVLEAREAERRLERRSQMVTRATERLLRDVEVTDAQRGQVEGLMADHVRRLEEVRGQDLGEELATQRVQELRDELLRGLEGVLDATQMETVAPRFERRLAEDAGRRAERLRGRRDGRRGGGRRGSDG